MSELLDCPFCGTEKEWLRYNKIEQVIQCNNCGAAGPDRLGNDDLDEASEAWNNRTDQGAEADNICELLATLVHFIPANEPKLIKDTMAMCYDIRSGIAAPKEQDTTDWKAEAERYRKGMANWKATAEEKDRSFAKALTEGIKKRVAQDAQPVVKESLITQSDAMQDKADWSAS